MVFQMVGCQLMMDYAIMPVKGYMSNGSSVSYKMQRPDNKLHLF